MLFVWDRADDASEFFLPLDGENARQVYPTVGAEWALEPVRRGLAVRTLPGPKARVILVPASAEEMRPAGSIR